MNQRRNLMPADQLEKFVGTRGQFETGANRVAIRLSKRPTQACEQELKLGRIFQTDTPLGPKPRRCALIAIISREPPVEIGSLDIPLIGGRRVDPVSIFTGFEPP